MGLGVKRCLSETAPVASKKLCGSRHSLSDVSFGCANLDLTQVQLDLQSFTNNFLRQLGDSVGMHATENTTRLACGGLGGAVASVSTWQGVSEQDWVACAELNALLHFFRHKLDEIPLESCHSFTRAAKEVFFNRLQQHTSAQPRTALQLSMTALLLKTPGLEQPEAAIRTYTSGLRHTCPQWLRSWCFRWGFTGDRVTVLALDMSPQSVPHLAGYDLLGYPMYKDMSGCSPVMTLYVPCLV